MEEETEFHSNPGEISQRKQFNRSCAPTFVGFFLVGGVAAFDGKNKNKSDANKTPVIQWRTNKNNLQKTTPQLSTQNARGKVQWGLFWNRRAHGKCGCQVHASRLEGRRGAPRRQREHLGESVNLDSVGEHVFFLIKIVTESAKYKK